MAINRDIRAELPEDAVVFDNYAYDNSIVGVTDNDQVVYDYDMMIKELMEDENLSVEEATEWIDYNTVRDLGYISGNKPIIVYPLMI